MKFYLYTSGVISQAQMDTFWADVAAAVAPNTVEWSKYDVSDGEPNGDEEAFAVYGPQKDWQDFVNKTLVQTGKPVITRWLV